MLSETRTLTFSTEMLMRALVPLLKQRGQEHARGAAADVQLVPQPQGFSLCITAGGTTERYRSEEIGAALVVFCIEQRIPLPKHYEKAVEWHGGNIALVIRHDIPTQPIPPGDVI